MKKHISILVFFFLITFSLSAQYFGRNKPHYRDFDFKVVETEHFEMYEYLDSPERVAEIAAWTEQWYTLHQAILEDTFKQKNPVIVYNDHAGFQQTNAIRGGISVGTGGVTEGLRNRVVYPVAATNQQTHHVLGHELVHAFQYNMVLNGDSTNMRNMANLPLWMVEGLAEYMSIGRHDTQTALWMRDAIMHDYLPSVKDLNDMRKYFPYRWGQAFWSYVAGTYGDEAIRPLFMNTAKYGLDLAIPMTLSTTKDSLSSGWKKSLETYYAPWVKKGDKENQPGKTLLSKENSGRMNICPSLSPNGKYVVFLSEKNVFSTDLFLADARTGKVIRKLYSSTKDGHIDQMNFIESAGTWSPKGKEFAFDAYEKGQSVLIIRDVEKRKTIKRFRSDKLPSFSNPVWSPDGKSIVVCGLVRGQHDLFSIDVKSKKISQLTNDIYSEALPNWSADGSKLTFSTDKLSMDQGRTDGEWVMNLAVMDMASGAVEMIDIFPGADNMNPNFDNIGKIIFLSDRDGFRNMYRYDPLDGKVYQMTDLKTGITGITPYAPAISVAEDRDRILYNYYEKGQYVIFGAKSEQFLNREVDSKAVDKSAGILPVFPTSKTDAVNANLRNLDKTMKDVAVTEVPYKSKFNLEYIGGSAGAGTTMTGNSSFGTTTGLAGGVDMLFGDILGNNQLYGGLAMSGEITDAAGQFSYINQKHKIGWGGNISHIPSRSGFFRQDNTLDSIFNLSGNYLGIGYKDEAYIQRTFQERFGAFSFLPISTTRRVEFGGAYELYHQRTDVYYYYVNPVTGQTVGQERERIKNPNNQKLNLFSINTAYVGDNSYFGFVAPLKGWRYRIGLEQFFGFYNFRTALLDGRKYLYAKPFSLAMRGMAYGRFGGNSDRVYPFFAANPFFVRGYTNAFLTNDAPELLDQMVGSKLGVANVELRLPFLGPRGLALIPVNFLPTDFNIFFDAGIAAYRLSDFSGEVSTLTGAKHKPMMSAGFSFRANILGAIVLEPYWAWPLSVNKDKRRLVFGLNFIPGW